MAESNITRGSLPFSMPGLVRPWAISVGHSKLLVRVLVGDPEGDEPLKVVDVLFQDVLRICLSDQSAALELKPAPEPVKAAEMERLGANWDESPMWLISPDKHTEYVVAGRVYWAEVAIHPGMSSSLLEETPDMRSFVGDRYFA
ncbi:hypothetical protein [Micromonospora sp. WMMD980]|uniref:hypothetical protein n=1 Tax=Micromonospora sp. WMMD980 TaxID=3016088 RepID=UPI002415FBF7|nr:hypothetical protein [Micromonospora sp. WMMD980]MDG4804939.1 hypothetical protein [Micromonospora sp. WMMD980]